MSDETTIGKAEAMALGLALLKEDLRYSEFAAADGAAGSHRRQRSHWHRGTDRCARLPRQIRKAETKR